MGNTTIQWTDKSWNPVRGCSRVSEGCRNCYAERQAARFAGLRFGYLKMEPQPFNGFVQIANGHPQWTGKVELVEKHLEDPLHWRQPSRVFVNSMSDLFHEGLDDEAISAVFAVMSQAPQHTFQILTKRPQRMLEWFSRSMCTDGVEESGITRFRWCHANTEGRWPLPNVWLGVSVEDQATADERIPLLLHTPAALRFVSYEPALGPVDFWNIPYKNGFTNSMARGNSFRIPALDWLIVGGESGPGARPFNIEWALETIAQCGLAKVPCFVKQFGSHVVSRNDTGFDGDTPRSWPMDTKTSDLTPEHFQGDLVRVHLRDRKGGDPEEWPEGCRVRQFPRHGTFTPLMATAMRDADADAERVLRGDA
jgi:protein gp37